MTNVIKVQNSRNKKFATVVKVDNGVYSLKFEDGEVKDIQEATFKQWYKEVATDETPATETPADDNETVPAPADEALATPEVVDAKALKEAEKAAKKAEADAKKAELKAKRDEAEASRLAKKAELDAKKASESAKTDEQKAAEKAEADAKKAAEKAVKDAEKADAKAKADAEKADAKAKKDAEKALRDAEKAAKDSAPKTKAVDRIQDFFGTMLTKLQAKYPDIVGNQTNRKKNTRVFRFGIGNFRYVVRLTDKTVTCELYIKASEKVSTDLLTEVAKYKEEIETALGYALVWDFNPDQMHSKAYTKLDIVNDADAIDWSIETLNQFFVVVTPHIEKVAGPAV